MKNTRRWLTQGLVFLFVMAAPYSLWGATSKAAKDSLGKLLLGKDVKPYVELPATKEGLNVYLETPKGKRADERGIDLASMSKELKSKGVGVDAQEMMTITDVKVGHDLVEIHLGGGGGHGKAKHGEAKQAGGSRVNFRYEREITDSDLDPTTFLSFMGRILDVSLIQAEREASTFHPEFQQAIADKTVKEGMTYQMVLLSFGDPEQKKINETTDGSLSETWYYLKSGHRWVINFTNGKVVKAQAF